MCENATEKIFVELITWKHRGFLTQFNALATCFVAAFGDKWNPLKFNTACVALALLHFIDRTAADRPYVPAGFLVPVKEKLLPGLYNRITRTWSLRASEPEIYTDAFCDVCVSVCERVQKLQLFQSA